jgi:hypothetical protein
MLGKIKGSTHGEKISKSISKSSDVCDELTKKPSSILESNKLCIAIMFIFYFLSSLVKKRRPLLLAIMCFYLGKMLDFIYF